MEKVEPVGFSDELICHLSNGDIVYALEVQLTEPGPCVRACMRACVRASVPCVRPCVRAVRACVRACVRVCRGAQCVCVRMRGGTRVRVLA